MGLDITINKLFYIGAFWRDENSVINIDVEINGRKYPINPKKVEFITEIGVNLRGAWSILSWFEQFYYDGYSGGKCFIERDDLEQLLADIDATLNNLDNIFDAPISKSTDETDEEFVEELTMAKEEISSLLKETEPYKDLVDFEFSASW